MITKIVITAERGHYNVRFTLATIDTDGPDFEESCESIQDVFDCIARNIAKENAYDEHSLELFDAVVM